METINNGKSIFEALVDIDISWQTLQYYAGLAGSLAGEMLHSTSSAVLDSVILPICSECGSQTVSRYRQLSIYSGIVFQETYTYIEN